MTYMMKREWARQKAVAGVRSPFTTRFDLYTSANAAGSGIDRNYDNRRQG
jgi:hypothetical protein